MQEPLPRAAVSKGTGGAALGSHGRPLVRVSLHPRGTRSPFQAASRNQNKNKIRPHGLHGRGKIRCLAPPHFTGHTQAAEIIPQNTTFRTTHLLQALAKTSTHRHLCMIQNHAFRKLHGHRLCRFMCTDTHRYTHIKCAPNPRCSGRTKGGNLCARAHTPCVFTYHAYLHVCIHISPTPTRTHTHVHIYACMVVCMYVFVCMYACMYVYTNVCVTTKPTPDTVHSPTPSQLHVESIQLACTCALCCCYALCMKREELLIFYSFWLRCFVDMLRYVGFLGRSQLFGSQSWRANLALGARQLHSWRANLGRQLLSWRAPTPVLARANCPTLPLPLHPFCIPFPF